MDRPRDLFSSPLFHIAIVGLLSALLLFGNLHNGGLSGYDDAVYAYEGRQMLDTRDWWNVQFNGHINFEYPPMFIWMEAVSMAILGPSDFAAKLPSALCGWLLIFLTFFIARELISDSTTAIIAAWVLMLTQYFMKYAMHAMTDVPFALFFALALFFYLRASKKPVFHVLCGLAIGVCILTRSVLGFLPPAIILTHIVMVRRLDILKSKEFAIGALLALMLPATWYVINYSIHGGVFVRGHFSFIGNKIKSGEAFQWTNFALGLTEYPVLLLKLYVPWLIISLIGLFWQTRKAVRERDSAAIFLILWVGFVIVPFSLASAKVLRYIMPIFPALAILAAIPLTVWLTRFVPQNYKKTAFAVVCLVVVVFASLPNPRLRAEGVVKIAPAIIGGTEPGTRIVLFTSGVLHHDQANQLLWYTNRLYDHIADINELSARLHSGEQLTFVADRPTFEQFIAHSGGEIEPVGETNEYVLFRNRRRN